MTKRETVVTMKNRFALVSLLFFSGLAIAAAGEMPARQILGVRLGMNEDQAHDQLKKIGTFVRAESLKQEVWKVNDPSYSNILIGFAKDGKLRYVTGVAREDKESKPVPYASVGDLKKAESKGDAKVRVYNYQWKLEPEKGEPETLVLAIGREPEKLSTLSLKRLGEGARAEDDD